MRAIHVEYYDKIYTMCIARARARARPSSRQRLVREIRVFERSLSLYAISTGYLRAFVRTEAFSREKTDNGRVIDIAYLTLWDASYPETGVSFANAYFVFRDGYDASLSRKIHPSPVLHRSLSRKLGRPFVRAKPRGNGAAINVLSRAFQ